MRVQKPRSRLEVTVLPSLSREPQKENAEKITARRNHETSTNPHTVIQRQAAWCRPPQVVRRVARSRKELSPVVLSLGGREEPRLMKPQASRATAPGSRGSCFGSLPVTRGSCGKQNTQCGKKRELLHSSAER